MKNSEQTKQTGLTKRTPALKGAVLIMVMTVMFVLIFLLAGTIAVVYSAHNRAMVKYEESQAYYTARSTLDAYLDAFLKDGSNKTGQNGSKKVTYYHIDKSGGSPTLKEDVEAKQGRAIELDLYALKVSVAPEGTGSLAYPITGKEPYWTTGAGSNPYPHDTELHDWVKKYILDLSAGGEFVIPSGSSIDQCITEQSTGCVGGGTADPAIQAKYAEARELAMKAINSEADDYKHATGSGITDELDVETPGANFDKYYNQFVATESTDTLYYRVPANTFKSYGNSTTGGSFGKVADTFTDNATDAVITVQLLERTMHLKEGEDFKLKFDSGNREKDHVKVKVTCEIMLDGVSTTTSVIYANKYDPKPSNQNALQALGGIDPSSSGFPVSGGFASLDGQATTALDASKIAGSVFVEGDFATKSSGTIKLQKGESYTIVHDFTTTNTMDVSALGEKTFFYVGGNFNVNNAFTFGSASDTQTTDLLVNQINWNSNPLKVAGNLYANVINMVNDGNFNGIKVDGDMYVNNIITKHDNNGNGLKVLSANADGTATIQVSDSGFYCGNTIVSDKIIFKDYYPSNDGTAHPTYNTDADKALGITNKDLVVPVDKASFVKSSDNSVPATVMTKGSSKVNLEYNDKDAFTFNAADKKKTFKMPDGKEFILETHQSKFADYYSEECFNDETLGTAGSFKDEFYATDPDTGEKYLDKTKLKDETKGITAAETLAVNNAGASAGCTLGSATTVSGGALTAGNYILNPGNVGNMTIDTSSGKAVVQLKAGTYSGTLTVNGTGELKLLIPTGAEVNWGDSGNGFRVVYAETLKNGDTIYVGDTPAGTEVTAVPNIDVYAGSGSKINVNEGGSTKSLLTGYFYGPNCNVTVNMAKQQFTYVKDGVNLGQFQYFALGSLVCGEYKNAGSDATGAGFIDRDAATKKAGEPNFAWTDVYYQRGV